MTLKNPITRTTILFTLLALPLLLTTACETNTNTKTTEIPDITDAIGSELLGQDTSNEDSDTPDENQDTPDENQDTTDDNEDTSDDTTREQNVGLNSCDTRGQRRCGDDGIPYRCDGNYWKNQRSCSRAQTCEDGMCVAFDGIRCHPTSQNSIIEYDRNGGSIIRSCPTGATCEPQSDGSGRCICPEGQEVDDKGNDNIYDDTCESVQCTSNSECGEGTCERFTGCVIDCSSGRYRDRYYCDGSEVYGQTWNQCGEGNTLRCCLRSIGLENQPLRTCVSPNICYIENSFDDPDTPGTTRFGYSYECISQGGIR